VQEETDDEGDGPQHHQRPTTVDPLRHRPPPTRIARSDASTIARMWWLDDERFKVGDATFRAIPEGPSASEFTETVRRAAKAGDLFVAKPRWRVSDYVELVDRLRPQRIVELGIYQGGSTALFAAVARPTRLVAIDKEPGGYDRLDRYVESRGLGEVVRTYGGVDQADAPRLAAIAEEAFDGQPIDLVVDDCSHRYEPTKVSFEELFPRMRPGGVYVIEDWPWAHSAVGSAHPAGMFPDEVPLTRLLFELVLAIPGAPRLISELSVDRNSVFVTRGEREVEPADFDLAQCSNPRGRSMLTPT
jgi:hypothetical protein